VRIPECGRCFWERIHTDKTGFDNPKGAMSERILIVNGSPRFDGNTDALLAELIKGAESRSSDPAHRKLRDLHIEECIGCCQCRDESTCHFQDDMSQMREEIEHSGVLVLATPNYWCGVTGLMKTFIDRLYFYHHPVNCTRIARKKAVVLSTMGEKTRIEYESALIIELFNRALKSLGIELVETVLFPGLMEKNDIAERPDYLKNAFELGRRIAAI
jgi:multimeric flavodoxin WrbA